MDYPVVRISTKFSRSDSCSIRSWSRRQGVRIVALKDHRHLQRQSNLPVFDHKFNEDGKVVTQGVLVELCGELRSRRLELSISAR